MIKKVIVITGASSGIGEATAKLLAAQGNQIVLGARRENRLQQIVKDIETNNGEATYAVTDVANLDSVKRLAKKAMSSYGRIDVWMNNAGVMPTAELSAGQVDYWNRMIDINIRGVLHGINASLDIMRAQKSGQYINTSSTAGHAVNAANGVYGATKAAVLAISDSLRQEEASAGSNTRVTVITPGSIATELTDAISDEEAKKAVKKFYAETAISPERIAETVSFAINALADTTLNEIIIRPTKQMI